MQGLQLTQRYFHLPRLCVRPDRNDAAAQNGSASAPGILHDLGEVMDGEHTIEQVLGELLVKGHDVASVIAALKHLENAGDIAESDQSPLFAFNDDERQRYLAQTQVFASWYRMGYAPAPEWAPEGFAAQLALKRATVAIVGGGRAGTAAARQMAVAGIGHVVMVRLEPEDGSNWHTANPHVKCFELSSLGRLPDTCGEHEPTLVFYCSDRFDEDVCRRLNSSCCHSGTPLLVYRRRLAFVEIGPLVIPSSTACYECCLLRRRGLTLGPAEAFEGLDNPMLALTLHVDAAVLEVIKFLTGVAEPSSKGKLMRLDLLGGDLLRHPVLKLPRCPVCGVHKVKPARKLWEEADDQFDGENSVASGRAGSPDGSTASAPSTA